MMSTAQKFITKDIHVVHLYVKYPQRTNFNSFGLLWMDFKAKN